ncbi:hypothetical protein [Niallia sp. 03091]|uniref:hypothetical protein n=1 Tax=unclassified Niallia TaxID=2837522 RepID=UPI004044FECD
MIHIVNGDVVGQKIKNLEGNVLVWREMYDIGPLSRDVPKEEWIKRAGLDFLKKKWVYLTLYF